MNFLQIITLVLFGVEFIMTLAVLVASEVLFVTLERKHTRYYQQIGRPTAMRLIYFPTSSDISRRFKSGPFVYRLMFKGMPANLPKSPDIRWKASILRVVGIAQFGAFLILAPLWVYFASRNMAP